MKDLSGKNTICVVSLKAPIAVQRANGVQAAAQLITCDEVREGASLVMLVKPLTAMVEERQVKVIGGRDQVVMGSAERDLEPMAPIMVPYENLGGWTIVEDTED